MDIRSYPRIIEKINAILDAGGIAEIKKEKDLGLTVVQIMRSLVATTENKKEK